jgi:hypothetical protein
MPPATNRTQRKRPGDLTGVRGQQLAAEAARQKEEASRQVQTALEVEREIKINTDVDYTSRNKPVVKTPVEVDGELVIEDVELENPTRRIRVNYPIEEMTFGKEVVSRGEFDENGNMVKAPILGGLRHYEFEEGRWYVVDADLADHLAYLGYIYE